MYSGKIYEVVVISINGDFETESNPQEVFHIPSKNRLILQIWELSAYRLFITKKVTQYTLKIVS